MKSEPPDKDRFFELLHRAARTTDKASRKSKRSGAYSGKKTGQHRLR